MTYNGLKTNALADEGDKGLHESFSREGSLIQGSLRWAGELYKGLDRSLKQKIHIKGF